MMLKYIIPLIPTLFVMSPKQEEIPKLPTDVAIEYKKISFQLDYINISNRFCQINASRVMALTKPNKKLDYALT